MSILKTRYKIVPTYDEQSKCNGYVVLNAVLFSLWEPLKAYKSDSEGNREEQDAFFKTYDDALSFLKHYTHIFTDEEILSNTGD